MDFKSMKQLVDMNMRIWNICKNRNNSCLIVLLRHMLEEPNDPWVKILDEHTEGCGGNNQL